MLRLPGTLLMGLPVSLLIILMAPITTGAVIIFKRCHIFFKKKGKKGELGPENSEPRISPPIAPRERVRVL